MELLKQNELKLLQIPSVFPTLENLKTTEKVYLQYKEELEDFLKKEESHAIGISLPQMGKNIAIFSINFGNKIETCFSPKINHKSSKTDRLFEGCLSFPRIHCLVERSNSVDVSYFVFEKNKWKHIKTKLIGVYARVFQHEFDHLNGITMLNIASELAPTTRRKLLKIRIDFDKYDYYVENNNVLIFENKEINPQIYSPKLIGIYE